jgi:hypothetical protein
VSDLFAGVRVTRPRYLPPHLRTGSEGQQACRKFWEQVGGIVYTTSDTRQVAATPGISDMLVILPNRRLFVGWESKQGFQGSYGPDHPKRLTDEQWEFGRWLNLRLTTAFGWGDDHAAQRWLLAQPRQTA